MTYLTQYATSNDPDFLKRVTMAMLDYAHDVATEDAGTAGHAIRLAYATQVANNPGSAAGAVSEAICAFNAAMAAASTDSEIKTSVAAIWNLLAGA